jgi:uncharacterized protein
LWGFKRREDRFYDLFAESTKLVCTAAQILGEIMDAPVTLPTRIQDLDEVEHQADIVTTSIIDHLNQTLITPMDREDIYTLAQSLDDIIDYVQGAAERMLLYKAGEPSKGSHEQVRLIIKATGVICSSFTMLKNMRGNRDDILKAATVLNQLESEGDKLYRLEVARLFDEEQNQIVIIKWKELLEHLETALDRCEDVGDLLKGMVLKYA